MYWCEFMRGLLMKIVINGVKLVKIVINGVKLMNLVNIYVKIDGWVFGWRIGWVFTSSPRVYLWGFIDEKLMKSESLNVWMWIFEGLLMKNVIFT